ncbi:Ribonuclease H-like superfamily [Sesbania bispinosa]|nr:Ribonuclease H-like superfamily [Sesbania bispinosa]
MGVGGLIRDRDKQWLGGFSRFAGCGNPLEAELLAVLSALDFAVGQMLENVILESDSLEVVTIFTVWDVGNTFHQHLGLIHAINSLLLELDCGLSSCFSFEGNKPAD